MELKGIAYLQNKLAMKRPRIALRYDYYEMKNLTFDFGISTPPDLRYWNSVVGWCAKAVDVMADRLTFYGFRDDLFDMEQIFNLNNRDVLIPSAVQDALIAACSFVAISRGDDGFPRLEVIDGGNATGVIDPQTGMLHEGYAVLERDLFNVAVREAYYTRDYTAYYENGALVDVFDNPADFPLLVPMIYRPSSVRHFGHSRISRACMSTVGSALRTIKRSEISAEFYSFPQKWVTGVDQNAQQMDKWSAAMSAMMKFELNENGTNEVKLGQFTQQSMEPHLSQLKMFAALFAGETGLTLDDLGFATENPSSSEAIRATHENLRLAVGRASRDFSVALLNVGFLAACVRDNYNYRRSQMYYTKPTWYPAFAADAAMLGAVGDGLGKLAQSFPDLASEQVVFELTGIHA